VAVESLSATFSQKVITLFAACLPVSLDLFHPSFSRPYQRVAIFSIRHATTYLYRRQVQMRVHRLQLLHRENRDIRVAFMERI
jgi:hypothetical protein